MPADAAGGDRLAVDGGTPAHQGDWPPWPRPTDEDAQALVDVLRSGAWCSAGGGTEVQAFAEAFAAMHAPGQDAADSPFDPDRAPLGCVAVTSGTSALILALQAVGVGPGDEVVVPPYTFIATASACLFLGAVPVFADIDPRTLCLDPADVERVLSARTKAVVPVHFAGCPADLDALTTLCHSRGLALVEDACQAPGAAWRGRPVGSWGTLGCFSFQETKNLSAGEGGAVTGRGADLERVWSLHNVGRTRGGPWYGHDLIGQNMRMTAFQGALLLSGMRRLPGQMARRSAAARRLAGVVEGPGVRVTHPAREVTTHAWHLFPLLYEPAAFGGRPRAQFVEALQAEGVPATAGYTLLSENSALHEAAQTNARRAGVADPRFGSDRLPVARNAAENTVWLGQSLLLADDTALDDISLAVAKIRHAWG